MKALKWLAIGFVGLVILGAIASSPEESKDSSNVSASETSTAREVADTTEAVPEPAGPEPVQVEHEGPFSTRTDQITLRGTVNMSGVGVKVDGKRAAVTGKKWSKVVTIENKGENEYRVIAFKKGHESDATMASVDRELSAAEQAVISQARAERRAAARAAAAERRANARAMESAESYLAMSGFSKQGLYQQLSSSAGEGFTQAEAQYAVDHVDVDWNQEAVQSARSYLEMGGFSRQALIEQLSSSAGEGFTYEQAVYAVNKVY